MYSDEQLQVDKGDLDLRLRHAADLADRRVVEVVVRLADPAGEIGCYRLVGADEIDPARLWISIDSPLARSLLGRTSGDRAEPHPGGKWEILAISYDAAC